MTSCWCEISRTNKRMEMRVLLFNYLNTHLLPSIVYALHSNYTCAFTRLREGKPEQSANSANIQAKMGLCGYNMRTQTL